MFYNARVTLFKLDANCVVYIYNGASVSCAALWHLFSYNEPPAWTPLSSQVHLNQVVQFCILTELLNTAYHVGILNRM